MAAERFLAGRAAMVTGGASGIGNAIALALASAGADVAIGSRHATKSACESAVAARGVRCLVKDTDVRSGASVRSFYDAAIEELGRIDILVNSAGHCERHVLRDHPDEVWHEIIDVNLNGAYRTTKLCFPGMIELGWGRIINIASDIALIGVPEYAAYCASKAALIGLTRCVALEGAPHGISCNAISPGWVETDMAIRAMQTAAEENDVSVGEYMRKIEQRNPQKRIIDPQEIAALAVFLCRDEAIGITLQDVAVTGGGFW